MGAAVAIIVRKQRDIVEVFQGARATSPEMARDPNDLGIDDSLIFRGLVRRAVLRDAGGGCYYVDELSWNAMTNNRRRVALAVAGIVLLVGVFLAMTVATRV